MAQGPPGPSSYGHKDLANESAASEELMSPGNPGTVGTVRGHAALTAPPTGPRPPKPHRVDRRPGQCTPGLCADDEVHPPPAPPAFGLSLRSLPRFPRYANDRPGPLLRTPRELSEDGQPRSVPALPSASADSLAAALRSDFARRFKSAGVATAVVPPDRVVALVDRSPSVRQPGTPVGEPHFDACEVVDPPPPLLFETQCAYITEFAVARHAPTRSRKPNRYLLGNVACSISSALSDTGCGPCVIGSRLLAALPADACVERMVTAPLVNTGLVGPSSEPLVTRGTVELMFTMSGVPFRHEFTVVEGGNLLLLGNDFLARYRASVTPFDGSTGSMDLHVRQKGQDRVLSVALSCEPRVDNSIAAAVAASSPTRPSPPRSRRHRIVAAVTSPTSSAPASFRPPLPPVEREHPELSPVCPKGCSASCAAESCVICGPGGMPDPKRLVASVATAVPDPAEESAHPALVSLVSAESPPLLPAAHISRQLISEEYLLYVEKPLQIEARTECTIWLRAPLSLSEDGQPARELFIDRLDGHATLDTGVKTACALVTPDEDGLVPVRLINVAPHPVTVGASTAVARARVDYEAEVADALDASSDDPYERLSLEHRDLIDKVIVDPSGRLDATQRLRVRALLAKRIRAFAVNPKRPAHTHLMEVELPMKPDSQPHRHAASRLGEAGNAIVDAHCAEMEANGIIRKSNSAWGSRVVLVKKKSGEIRFCIDFRDCNRKLITLDSPIPRCDEAIDRLSSGVGPQDSLFLSTLDLASGFWTLPIKESDKCVTAFVTNRQKYEWNYLPFGIQSGPSYMCRLMDAALQGLAWDICVPYLDDVGVHSTGVGDTFEERELASFEQQMERLDLVLERFVWAGLTAKASKCILFATKTAYLGHQIGRDGLSMDPEKLDKIRNLDPTSINTVERVRSFLGLCSYYRRFVSGFARITAPLTDLTRDGVDVAVESQTPACQLAVSELIVCMTSEPVVLTMPRFDREFIVKTDAAATEGIGGVLSQLDDDGHERVIAYYGRRLTPAERKWTVTEIELLAALESIRTWRPYLWGRHFRLVIDHAALKWLHTMKDTIEGGPASRLMRWNMKLLEYDYEVEHKPGKDHSDADGVSRLVAAAIRRYPVSTAQRLRAEERLQRLKSEGAARVVDGYLNVGTPTADALCQAQRDDPDCQALDKFVSSGEFGPLDNPAAMRRAQWIRDEARHLCRRDDGVLVRVDPHSPPKHGRPVPSSSPRPYIPTTLRLAYLNAFHDAMGHPGVSRTTALLRSRVYWPGMHADVQTYVRECHECTVAKAAYHSPLVDPSRPTIGAYPFDSVVCDICSMGLTLDGKYDKLMVFADSLSRWVEAVPCLGDPTAEQVLDAYATHVACRYGWPRELRSDGGSNLANLLAEEVHRVSGVSLRRGAPYRPQSQGIAERVQRTLAAMCRTADEGGGRWAEHLPYLLFSYHATPHRVTGLSPAMIVYGHEMRLPAQLGDGVSLPASESPIDPVPADQLAYAKRLHSLLNAAWGAARNATAEVQEVEFRRQCARSPHRVYVEGDRVCHLLNTDQPKLCSPWSTPCRVAEVLGSGNYRLQDVANHLMSDVFHVSRLRPYRTKIDAIELAPDEYLVDRLVDHRSVPNSSERQYKVKWRREPLSRATWEPRAELMRRCTTLVEEYDTAHPPPPRPARRHLSAPPPPPAPRVLPRTEAVIESDDLPHRAVFERGRWQYVRRMATPRGLRDRIFDSNIYTHAELESQHFKELRTKHLAVLPRTVAAAIPQPIRYRDEHGRICSGKVAFYDPDTESVYCWRRRLWKPRPGTPELGNFDFPGGHRDTSDDSDVDAVIRELDEELCLPPRFRERIVDNIRAQPAVADEFIHPHTGDTHYVSLWVVYVSETDCQLIQQSAEGASEGAEPMMRPVRKVAGDFVFRRLLIRALRAQRLNQRRSGA